MEQKPRTQNAGKKRSFSGICITSLAVMAFLALRSC